MNTSDNKISNNNNNNNNNMYIHLLAGGYVYDHDWKDTNSGVAPGDMRVFPTIIILRFFLSFFSIPFASD
jgi:hypothetical protein